MSTASLKTRLARLEVATPATEFSLEVVTAICRRLGTVDLDSAAGSPELRETRRQLKELLARLTEV